MKALAKIQLLALFFQRLIRVAGAKRHIKKEALTFMTSKASSYHTLRQRGFRLLFDHNTAVGRRAETVWILVAMVSVLMLFFESGEYTVFSGIPDASNFFLWCEITFTVIFTLEYLLRLICTPTSERYPTSFFGVIDLVTILPLYIVMILPGITSTTELVVLLRLLRVLRVLRVLKLLRYMNEAGALWRSLLRARHKLTLFFGFVGILLCVFGGLMYAVEGGKDGFTTLAASVYWAVVTLTTVGYGDITPHTALGRILASILILVGYSIIAVPTGILTAYMSEELQRNRQRRSCSFCQRIGHEESANFCVKCGNALPAIPGMSLQGKRSAQE